MNNIKIKKPINLLLARAVFKKYATDIAKMIGIKLWSKEMTDMGGRKGGNIMFSVWRSSSCRRGKSRVEIKMAYSKDNYVALGIEIIYSDIPNITPLEREIKEKVKEGIIKKYPLTDIDVDVGINDLKIPRLKSRKKVVEQLCSALKIYRRTSNKKMVCEIKKIFTAMKKKEMLENLISELFKKETGGIVERILTK